MTDGLSRSWSSKKTFWYEGRLCVTDRRLRLSIAAPKPIEAVRNKTRLQKYLSLQLSQRAQTKSKHRLSQAAAQKVTFRLTTLRLTHIVVVFLLSILGESSDICIGQRQAKVGGGGFSHVQVHQNGLHRTDGRVAAVPVRWRRVLVMRRSHRRRQRRR
jgi:hypothetical protein